MDNKTLDARRAVPVKSAVVFGPARPEFKWVDPAGVPLIGAASRGEFGAVARLANKESACLRCDHGWTALHYAAFRGCSESIRILLPLSDPGWAAAGGETPLMLAAMAGRSEAVAELLPVSDLGARDRVGLTAAGIASRHAHPEIARQIARRATAIEREALSEDARPGLPSGPARSL